jgi:hypothetical protein
MDSIRRFWCAKREFSYVRETHTNNIAFRRIFAANVAFVDCAEAHDLPSSDARVASISFNHSWPSLAALESVPILEYLLPFMAPWECQ